jgi:hypothetical protein
MAKSTISVRDCKIITGTSLGQNGVVPLSVKGFRNDMDAFKFLI